MFTYKTKGTCSSQIDLEIRDGVITHCKFTGGCRGNTVGLAAAVIGQNAEAIPPAPISWPRPSAPTTTDLRKENTIVPRDSRHLV